MKQKFVNSSINFITKYQECDDLKLKRLKYGLEGIYGVITKLIIVLIIAILTKTIKETALLILFYGGIRTFSFGWHAKSTLACLVTTISIYNISPFLISQLHLPTYIGYFTLIIAFISVILWAPADTPKRPLIKKDKRLISKFFSIAIVIIYSIILLFSNSNLINNTIIFALLIQTIMINPLTYKLTNTRFNNYKYYNTKN